MQTNSVSQKVSNPSSQTHWYSDETKRVFDITPDASLLTSPSYRKFRWKFGRSGFKIHSQNTKLLIDDLENFTVNRYANEKFKVKISWILVGKFLN